MDNKKFEQLIDLIINENEEKARELFHEIVVEKSREIYESIMDEEMMGDMEEGAGMVGQVGDLLDEINTEEAGGMTEEDDGMDDMDDLAGEDEEVVDINASDMGEEDGAEEIEDAVVRIEDKLDQLMAEFEEIMGGGDEEGEEGEEDFGGEEGEEDLGGEEGEEDFGGEEGDEESQEMMEAVELRQVGGKTYNTYGQMGDNGDNTKSIALKDPKVKVPGVNPVKFSGSGESVPTGPKSPSNAYTKGQKEVENANNWKNVAGGSTNAGKTSFKEKVPGGFGHNTPQGKEAGAGGSVSQNDKSVLESRRTAKKRI